MEDHIGVPIPPFCSNKLWLALWAAVGLRNSRQANLTRRDVYETNVEHMKSVRYPTKRELRYQAKASGVDISFVERENLLFRSGGRFGRILHSAQKFGVDRALVYLMQPMLQRLMVLRKST